MTAICRQCGCQFEGRADALYCSAAHRQAAYVARRGVSQTAPRPAEHDGMVLVSADALTAIRDAVAVGWERIERARSLGATPNFELYWRAVSDALRAIV